MLNQQYSVSFCDLTCALDELCTTKCSPSVNRDESRCFSLALLSSACAFDFFFGCCCDRGPATCTPSSGAGAVDFFAIAASLGTGLFWSSRPFACKGGGGALYSHGVGHPLRRGRVPVECDKTGLDVRFESNQHHTFRRLDCQALDRSSRGRLTVQCLPIFLPLPWLCCLADPGAGMSAAMQPVYPTYLDLQCLSAAELVSFLYLWQTAKRRFLDHLPHICVLVVPHSSWR